MQVLIIFALLFIKAALAVPMARTTLAPLIPPEENENTVPEEYIVVFKKAATELNVWNHMEYLNTMMLAELNDTYQIRYVYDMGPMLRGYAALINDKMLNSVRGMWEVDYVERNQLGDWGKVHVHEPREKSPEWFFCKEQRLTNANWALSRISHADIQQPPLTYRYSRFAQGSGVNVYVIDSGIDTTNQDFEGRAIWGINLVGGPNVDTIGHGTQVAGCAMSKTYGVAKKATAVAIKIDKGGLPDAAAAVAAFTWIKNNHKSKKSVASGSFNVNSNTVNTAADALVDAGVPTIILAHNYQSDACYFNPSSASKVVTVAASDRNDNFATFSNFGTCVDIIAPGVQIQTTGLNNQNPVTVDGTSFSTPYTAGVVAKILGTGSMTGDEAVTKLFERAVSNKIMNVPQGTPNILLNSVCY